MISQASRLIQSARQVTKDTIDFLAGIKPYANKEYFTLYVKEVEDDIRVLELFMIHPRFEREQDKIYQHLRQKYDDYCPSKFYDRFNFENKIRYLTLRSKIDDILAKENK